MKRPTAKLYDIEVSHDGRKVWVTSSDGSCVGRFDKYFGVDVHRTVSEQMAGKDQCLFCTHEPADAAAWEMFRAQILEHHGIEVPADLVSFP